MKKILTIISVFVLFFLGLLYLQKMNKSVPNPNLTSFRNSNLGISFIYPKNLIASSTKESVHLHHEVPFEHHDFCDFKGEGTTTIPTLSDFSVHFHTSDKNLVDTIKTESPYIPEENFVNGAVVPSPGFIDSFDNGVFQGFSIFEGAEGCGHTIYYLKVSERKTLVVTNDFITIFSGSIDTDNMNRALAVPGVINKERAMEIFESVMKTVKVE